jgi:conjugative relaxase-like TrwC/TraI family protein
MLAAKPQTRLSDAKKYFKEHLSVGDYYAEGQSVAGQWFGKGAADLGLNGITTSDEFTRLCDNLHPQTGERLTLRQKTTRIEKGTDGKEHETANRRVFYDFTFSPTKSVSIAALAGDDHRIVEAHEQAVTVALHQLETFASTRVRKAGQCTDRPTGNIVAAVFRHETSRALDPHLHSHCILFNATFDPVEKQWKALQNHEMFGAQKFVENVYYHELARALVKFGYQIENRPRGDFEIKGVSLELVKKFSKRHEEIDQKTRELLAREPEKADGNIAAIRENIAHRERARKIRDIGLEKLQVLWDGQMTPQEKDSLHRLAVNRSPTSDVTANLAEKAVTWAEEHLFERRSVVHEHELWRHALEHARGQNVSLTEIQAVTKQRDYIRKEDKPDQITTREHLQREWEIVCAAKDGRGKFGSFQPDYRSSNTQLDEEQRKAVERIMDSNDFITLFRGGAGTGKSFTLREVQGELEKAGHSVQVVAPQRQQVMDLERDGFKRVQTLSALLAKRELARDAVLLVDEAGQIGGKQMHALLRLAQDNHARLILSGDTRQHGAVEASDALRAIEKYAGLDAIELTNIRRQNPALAKSIAERERIKQYRQAVEAARDGHQAQSFHLLNQLKAIEQCTLADQHEKLAARYLALVKEHQSCAVVSQSWDEIHQLNDEIRAVLKHQKLIGDSDTTVTGFQPLNLTNAQKRDARSYGSDSVLVFNRDVRGFKAGDSARLKEVADKYLWVEAGPRLVSIPFTHLDKVTVCQRREMALAAGDKLQLKANGRSANRRKLANGELVTVKEIQPDGQIALADGRVLDKNFRQFVRGYAITSYASQGKSVDYVLFSDSAVKAATNNQQWYVTISRGKKGIHIFTCDKEQLQENISRSGQRPLAVDLVPSWVTNRLAWRLNLGRYGRQAAEIMERARRKRSFETLRQRVVQRTIQQTPAVKQSHGIHM